MDDYLSKPFSLDQLERTLRRWLPAAPGMEGEPHVDAEAIERILVLGGGGHALLNKMIDVYLQDGRERIAAIREGMASADADAVSRAAHAFKSASANLGAAALAEMCKRLERQSGGGSTLEAEAVVAAIEEEFAYVAADLSGRVRRATA
jgi:HPt (histidine-containing phosphotransfer) domain-containing protein